MHHRARISRHLRRLPGSALRLRRNSQKEKARPALHPGFPGHPAAVGVALTYTVFHYTGDLLARLPTKYHEGSYMEGVIDFIKDPTKFDEEE